MVTERAFSSTNSAPSVQTRSSSTSRDSVTPLCSTSSRSSRCSVLLSSTACPSEKKRMAGKSKEKRRLV